MANIIYDINTVLKNDSALQAITGQNPVLIYPGVAPDSAVAPVILYFWTPSIVDVDRYYMNRDTLRYCIKDTDSDRAFETARRIVAVLNLADGIQGTVASSDSRTLWMNLVRSSFWPPVEREGYYEVNRWFEVGYVPVS